MAADLRELGAFGARAAGLEPATIRLQSERSIGIVLFDDVVVETAPIVRYMRRWSRDRVRGYCTKQGWRITVVHRIQREHVTAPQVKAGVRQHDESFEAVRPDGAVEFFYFDDNAGRRAVTGKMSKEQALKAAQEFLGGLNR